MGKYIDLTGKRFGRLLVLQRDGCNKHGQVKWWCECDCGIQKHILGMSLSRGETKSCGCLHREMTSKASVTHGKSKSKIWNIHRSMIDRCHLPTNDAYQRYGGRGISVAPEWHNFENFYRDMGDKPVGMSLERIDNNGDYCKENVVWATAKQQSNNRRNNVVLEHNGKKQTMQQWCDELGLKIGTVWARLNRGWDVSRSLTQEVRHVSV